MKRSYILLGVVLAFALTILSGVLQGRMRNRWGPSPDTVRAAGKLAKVPTQFGDWRLSSTGKLDETAEKMLECTAYFVRSYQNQATGDLVSVTVLLGPPGPISVHTPEVCFGSRDYRLMGKREEVVIRGADGQDDQLWALSYKNTTVSAATCSACIMPGAPANAGRPAATRVSSMPVNPICTKSNFPRRCRRERICKPTIPAEKFLEDFLPAAGSA